MSLSRNKDCLIFEDSIVIHCKEGSFYTYAPNEIYNLNRQENDILRNEPIASLTFQSSQWFIHFKEYIYQTGKWKERLTETFSEQDEYKGFWVWLGFIDYLYRHHLDAIEGIALIGLRRFAEHFPKINKLMAATCHRESKRLMAFDIKSAKASSDLALQLYKKIASKRGIAIATLQLAKIHLKEEAFEKALSFVDSAIGDFQFLKSPLYEADGIITRGHLNLVQNHLEKANIDFNLALRILEKENEELGVARCLNNIGVVKDQLNDNQEAIRTYEKCIPIFEKLKNSHGSIQTNINLGLLYEKQNQIETAVQYYEKALLKSETTNNFRLLMNSIHNLRIALRKAGDWERAYEVNLKVVNQRNQAFTIADIAKTHLNLGAISIRLKNLEQANKHLLLAIEYFDKSNDKNGLAVSYESLGAVLEDMERNDLALECREKQLAFCSERQDAIGIGNSLMAIGILQRKMLAFTDSANSFQKAIGQYSHEACTEGMLSGLLQMAKTMHIIGDFPSFLVCVKGIDVAMSQNPTPEAQYYFQQLELLYGLRDTAASAVKVHRLCMGLQHALDLLMIPPDSQHDSTFALVEAIHWFISKGEDDKARFWIEMTYELADIEWHPLQKTLQRLKKKYCT